jgi:hypothetical protein
VAVVVAILAAGAGSAPVAMAVAVLLVRFVATGAVTAHTQSAAHAGCGGRGVYHGTGSSGAGRRQVASQVKERAAGHEPSSSCG